MKKEDVIEAIKTAVKCANAVHDKRVGYGHRESDNRSCFHAQMMSLRNVAMELELNELYEDITYIMNNDDQPGPIKP